MASSRPERARRDARAVLSRHNWSATNTSGEVKDVGPGRSVTLAAGTRINFGRAEGEITF
ncbi:MAG: hypothetical protein M3362_02275 [Acidobacteriota bacterium]|nr:hypothetical protein [Acidobacteriota bacterium]